MPQGDTILVIDDEAIMQEILADFLREEGFEVDIAGSGEEGLDLAREHPYDCAIVDLMMPGIDGIETMQALKRRDPELPVIIFDDGGARVASGVYYCRLAALGYNETVKTLLLR